MSDIEYGYVIERENSSPAAPLYLEFISEKYEPTGQQIDGWGWNFDNLKAARFARAEDAEKFWRCVIGREPNEVRIACLAWG